MWHRWLHKLLVSALFWTLFFVNADLSLKCRPMTLLLQILSTQLLRSGDLIYRGRQNWSCIPLSRVRKVHQGLDWAFQQLSDGNAPSVESKGSSWAGPNQNEVQGGTKTISHLFPTKEVFTEISHCLQLLFSRCASSMHLDKRGERSVILGVGWFWERG